MCVCVCSERVCVTGSVRALSWHGGDLRYLFMARTAARGRPRVRLSIRARLAAGAMWRCRTANAPWAGRWGHTSVVDAAGAIYVLGGQGTGKSTFYNDVWKSADGGV
jgi:hypothetical protein